MTFDLIAELEALSDAFDREHVEYAVCGGLALGYHGFVRATDDIDVLVPAAVVDTALAVARANGFDIPARKITFGLAAGTPREVQRVSKLDSTNGQLLTLDLLVVAPDLEEVWRTRIKIEPVPGRTMTIVSRAGLATMKRMAGRPQDLVDLERLEHLDDDEETP